MIMTSSCIVPEKQNDPERWYGNITGAFARRSDAYLLIKWISDSHDDADAGRNS